MAPSLARICFVVAIAIQAAVTVAQSCSCDACDTSPPPCYASRWYMWWRKDDCSAQTLWNNVKNSDDVRTSVFAVWGPGTPGASQKFQDFVLMAADNNNSDCVKIYLLDWIKCKAAVTDSAVQFYNSVLGVGVTSIKDVRSMAEIMTTIIKMIGQGAFNTLAKSLKKRDLEAQIVVAATWC